MKRKFGSISFFSLVIVGTLFLLGFSPTVQGQTMIKPVSISKGVMGFDYEGVSSILTLLSQNSSWKPQNFLGNPKILAPLSDQERNLSNQGLIFLKRHWNQMSPNLKGLIIQSIPLFSKSQEKELQTLFPSNRAPSFQLYLSNQIEFQSFLDSSFLGPLDEYFQGSLIYPPKGALMDRIRVFWLRLVSINFLLRGKPQLDFETRKLFEEIYQRYLKVYRGSKEWRFHWANDFLTTYAYSPIEREAANVLDSKFYAIMERLNGYLIGSGKALKELKRHLDSNG